MYFIYIQFKYHNSDISMRLKVAEISFPISSSYCQILHNQNIYQKTFNQGQALVFKRPHIQIGKNEYSTINTSIRNAVQNNYMIHFSKIISFVDKYGILFCMLRN